MRQTIRRGRWAVALPCLLASEPAWAQFAAENAAMALLDRLLAAINGRDAVATCGTLHYPHLRFHGVAVDLDESVDDCVERIDFDRLAARSGWHRSGWDARTVVQAYPDKVHVTVVSSRYDAAGARIGQSDALYIITRVDGRWGIRATSSF